MSSLQEYEFKKLPLYVRHIIKAILAGDKVLLTRLVTNGDKWGQQIGWWWEPYSAIQTRAQLECLAYVLDQPHFIFDAPFVAACCHFSTMPLRNLVLSHPRSADWVETPEQFQIDIYNAYQVKGYTNISHDHHSYHAQNEIYKRHMLRKKFRAIVTLYAFFTVCSRIFREEYYAVGGKGYLKSKASFEAIAVL